MQPVFPHALNTTQKPPPLPPRRMHNLHDPLSVVDHVDAKKLPLPATVLHDAGFSFENIPYTLFWPLAARVTFENCASGKRFPALRLSRTLFFGKGGVGLVFWYHTTERNGKVGGSR